MKQRAREREGDEIAAPWSSRDWEKSTMEWMLGKIFLVELSRVELVSMNWKE